jgi:hypothetical protein
MQDHSDISIKKSKLLRVPVSSLLNKRIKSYIERGAVYSQRGHDELVEHYLDLDSAFGADSDSGDSSGSEDPGDGSHVPLMAGLRGGPSGTKGRADDREESSQRILVR